MQTEAVIERPMARATDPESSHLAAEAMKISGKLGFQQRKALQLVIANPGATSAELARASDGMLDRYQVARRLPELEAAELVTKGAMRECEVTERPCVTWFSNVDL